MDASSRSERSRVKHPTTADRRSDRELVITRTFDAPARIVFEAWTRPELLQRWWVPKSVGLTLLSCEADVRVGGTYRFVFACEGTEGMAFYGTYLEVTPPSRLVWTNDEGEGQVITTITFDEKAGKTHLVMHDLYPSKEALDAAMASGEKSCTGESFDQLDDVLAS